MPGSPRLFGCVRDAARMRPGLSLFGAAPGPDAARDGPVPFRGMGGFRSVFYRLERAVLRTLMRAGAKIADRRVAKEVQERRGKNGGA